jgi:SAM-dependent methyltransferase
MDFSDIQLTRDQQAAEYHSLSIEIIQGDMRDLSRYPNKSFDLVWQPYSVNFVPCVEPVYREVARVLKPDGIYYMQFANPFVHSVDDEAWDGNAFPLYRVYIDGEDTSIYFPHWIITQDDGSSLKIDSPHEYRHTLSTVLNTLAKYGFIFLDLKEYMLKDDNPEPGSWTHFTRVAPPWFDSFWKLKSGA